MKVDDDPESGAQMPQIVENMRNVKGDTRMSDLGAKWRIIGAFAARGCFAKDAHQCVTANRVAA